MAHERPLLDNSPRPPPSPSPSPYPDPPTTIHDRLDSDPSSTTQPPTDPTSRFMSSLREMPDDNARLVYVGDPDRTNDRFDFSGNSIRTGKYSVLTFFPKNLFEQFHRVAYVYFLVIAILNQLPMLAVFGRGASILPLAFVLLVTLVKDGYEDWRRHRSDRYENNRTSLVFSDDGEFYPKSWKDLRVGEVIKICVNETLPCDMVLLSTSDPTGVAYIQTINLDGESNLKTRYAKQETLFKEPENGGTGGFWGRSTPFVIRCEQPNRNIYGFMANIEIDGRRSSLGPSNIILRGCELKNTNWVIGVAVYSGRDTKVMLNSSGASSKRSRLETHMNRETLSLSIILFVLCLVVSVLDGIWLGNHKEELNIAPFFRKESFSGMYMGRNFDYYGIGWEVFFTFLKSVIVFQIMIPISLYISMELVRLGQAYFMIRDQNLYDETSNSRFQCRALSINEDLGQIRYVFSDKTGTLTENKMEFQCASIGGVDYRNEKSLTGNASYVTVNGELWRPKMMVKTDPELLNILISERNTEADTERWNYTHDFFLALAACNTIVPLVVESPEANVKLIDYQGESPDEQALVYAAAAHGFILIERTSGHIIIDILGNRHRFIVLGLHEFDSERKRMSVIIGFPDGTTKLFVKGADNSVLGILDSLNQDVVIKTEAHLNAYSSLGLRTLVVGTRELSRSEFDEWNLAYETAGTALLGRAGLMRNVAVGIECRLRLLGASGIEDKLQEGVPEAIDSLRQAGIKVWVLTGDKQETAISIGYSCKLISNEMTQIVINSHSRESCERGLRDAVTMSKKVLAMGLARSPLALIIDGNSLVYILENELEEELFEVAITCDVVLCCRVAPLQKAGIVALIKNRTDDMTLAIGDGANDVSMIQMADVGIGISGQEGRQAVMASDFAMGQFRFLVQLLLVHGHWNYQRMAYMILYNFYRNSIFVFILFWYVLFTAFSLTTAVTDWSSVLYSIVYTALPTIIVGVLDKDLKRKTLLKYPQLYSAGQREETYNLKLFLLTMMDSIWQSLVIFFIPYFCYMYSTIDGSSLGDLLTLAVVIMVNIHLAMDVFRWNWITHIATWGCIFATAVCMVIIDCFPWLPGFWAILHIIATSLFWLCLSAILVVGMVPRFTIKVLSEYFSPTDIQIAREQEKIISNASECGTSEFELTNFSNTPSLPAQSIQ